MTTAAGVCRFCGCTETMACFINDGQGFGECGCYWTDRTKSVCSACDPAAKAEKIALGVMARAGYRSGRPGIKAPLEFVAAFHQGFVIGWFGISPRSKYGRNPYFKVGQRISQLEAWELGHQGGAEASRGYQRVCGPLGNAPRKEVLQNERRRRSRGAPSTRTTTQVPQRRTGRSG